MSKAKKIIYWVVTLWFALGMGTSAIVQIAKVPPEAVSNMIHLGYPPYFFTILGVWKILGIIAILAPGFLLLKEWAYAGFFFVTTGAFISHVVTGDAFWDIFPSILLGTLTVVSWCLRPASRKMVSTN